MLVLDEATEWMTWMTKESSAVADVVILHLAHGADIPPSKSSYSPAMHDILRKCGLSSWDPCAAWAIALLHPGCQYNHRSLPISRRKSIN